MDSNGLMLFHSLISLDSTVMPYGAVVTGTKVLANNGDFVLIEHEEVCSIIRCVNSRCLYCVHSNRLNSVFCLPASLMLRMENNFV